MLEEVVSTFSVTLSVVTQKGFPVLLSDMFISLSKGVVLS